MPFVLSLLVPHLFSFSCHGKAALRNCDISYVSLFVFSYLFSRTLCYFEKESILKEEILSFRVDHFVRRKTNKFDMVTLHEKVYILLHST